MDLYDIAIASKLGGGGGGGGASNVVTGTLVAEAATTDAGKVYTIDTGYTGDGYVIAFAIMCTSSSLYDVTTTTQYVGVSAYKRILSEPTYSGTSNANKGIVVPIKKRSSALEPDYSEDTIYSSSYTPSGGSVSGVITIANKNTVKVYVAGSNSNYKGLKPNQTYQYWVLYSE